MREKLIKLLETVPPLDAAIIGLRGGKQLLSTSRIADHLIANGVTVQDKTEISEELLEQLRNAPVTILQEEPTIEVVQQWIPVTERLPEDDDQLHFYDDGIMRCITVLAYTEYGRTIPKNRLLVRPTGNKYLEKQVTNGWVWASGTEEVTHWMPLPQPPKEE